MIHLFLNSQEINLLLREVEGPWRYEHGCLHGRVKLPLGAVQFVIVPTQQGDWLVLSIPFDQMRGDISRGMMGMLVKMLWGFIKDKAEQQISRVLRQQGLPPETVVVEQRKDRHGTNGVVAISLAHVNQWLARKPLIGHLRPFLQDIHFGSEGVQARVGLYSK